MRENSYIYKRLLEIVNDNELMERVNVFVNMIRKYVHAPISLKDYKRMERFADDEELVIVVYEAIKDYFKEDDITQFFDTIGHTYCIALLSQSKFNRDNTLKYLNETVERLVKNNFRSYGHVMYRNMNRLSKEYPDLKEFENKLKCFKDYDYWKEKKGGNS